MDLDQASKTLNEIATLDGRKHRSYRHMQAVQIGLTLLVEVKRLQKVLDEIYPHLAGRAIQLEQAGEEKAAASWAAVCRKVAGTWAGTQPDGMGVMGDA